MIHLDTNYLIGLLVQGSPEATQVEQWLAANEQLATSAIAWCEFLNGPVTSTETIQVSALLDSRIVPFGQAEAVLAARLFNQTGRRRGSRFDCLIAATAILGGASLATVNRADFKAFGAQGLQLV